MTDIQAYKKLLSVIVQVESLADVTHDPTYLKGFREIIIDLHDFKGWMEQDKP
jgi:hypothetical protein